MFSPWSIHHSSKLLVLSALPLQTSKPLEEARRVGCRVAAGGFVEGKEEAACSSSMLARRNVQATMCNVRWLGRKELRRGASYNLYVKYEMHLG